MRLVVAFVVLATLLTGIVASTNVGFGASPKDVTCSPKWRTVPNPTPKDGELNDIAAFSPADLWTVGDRFDAKDATRTLIEHWNGKSWQRIPSPNVGAKDNSLSSVAGSATNDLWAVGSSGGRVERALFEHWDGSQWTVIPAPGVNSQEELWAVSAISADDVWAAGASIRSVFDRQGLLEHWDGSAWSRVLGPQGATFTGLAAISSADVWAVGGRHQNPETPLTEHWDGAHWSLVRSARPGTGINDVSASSPTDAWAVGDHDAGPYVAHWDGRVWVPSHVPYSHWKQNFQHQTNSWLHGVADISPTAVWIVGEFGIEHWNGRAWRAARPSAVDSSAVVALSADDVWVVGGRRIDHLTCT